MVIKREGQLKNLFNLRESDIDISGGNNIGKLENIFEIMIEKS